MNAAAAQLGPKAQRRPRIAKIQIAKKQLELDDDTYRALLGRLFGKASSTQLTLAQLDELLEHFKSEGFRPAPPKRPAPARAGSRALAANKYARKVRALWISLYHLGVVRDPAEAALVAYVRRVTGGAGRGIEALEWLKADAASSAIEALKAMAVREGGVNWNALVESVWEGELSPAYADRYAVVVALHAQALDLGAMVEWPGLWRQACAITGIDTPADFEAADWDKVIEAFGARNRPWRGAR